MINALVSVLDRLIELRKYRGERTRRIFDKVFEPIFSDLLLIHKDYVGMFEKAVNDLQVGESDAQYSARMKIVISDLRTRRIEFEPVRRNIQILSRELHSSDLSAEAKEFVQAVINYFPNGKLIDRALGGKVVLIRSRNDEDSPSERVITLLTQMYYWSDEETVEQSELDFKNIDPILIAKIIQGTIQQLRESWALVCEKFAVLKISAASSD